MPFEERGVGLGKPGKWRCAERLTVVTAKGRIHAFTMDGPGNHDLEVWQNRECTGVEQLVVESTQGEAVGNDWGSHCLVPSDVRCFERERGVVETAGERADGASISIGPEYPAAKCRIALPTVSDYDVLLT